MGWFGLRLGWSFEVQGISNPDYNTLLRQNPARLNPEEPCPMTVPTPHQGTPWAVIWDDIVCLTIRYHETDTLASKTACKSP